MEASSKRETEKSPPCCDGSRFLPRQQGGVTVGPRVVPQRKKLHIWLGGHTCFLLWLLSDLIPADGVVHQPHIMVLVQVEEASSLT